MTAAEKTMLRYEYTMQRLGMAQGDYARTSKTWANQVRLLKQQFQALGAVVGQGLIYALKPALIAMNAFLSRVIEFAKKVLNALGKIFGWEVEVNAGSIDTDLDGAEEAASGLGDALGGAGDAAKGASDAVKELNKQVQGFDKLNIITTTDKGGSGGSGGSGGGSGSGGGAGGGAGGADPLVDIKKTTGFFESEINNLRELGVYIRNSLMDAMDSIPWDSIYEKARGFGTGLAQFLNGLFSGSGKSNVFASLGRTVAGAINTALNFFDSFGEVFDFSTFGRNLASFFVETIANIDWTMAGKAFHEWMQGIKDAFKAFVAYLWNNKDEVWKAIKDFFSEVEIEDIAILIGLITIKKIAGWALAGGVMQLASEAIGELFKSIAIKIGVKITGLTAAEVAYGGIGGFLAELGLFGSNGLIANALGLALLEGTGAATVGGALATFALPIAFSITPIIMHKILSNMYEDAKKEGDKTKQDIIEHAFGKRASITRTRAADGTDRYDVDMEVGINWKLLFGKVIDKLPWKDQGFFSWLGSKMFPTSIEVDGKTIDIDYTGNIGFGFGNGKKFEFPWKGIGFFKWLAQKLFPSTVKVNGEEVSINYGVKLDFDFGFGNGKFKNFLREKLGLGNDKDDITVTTGIKKGKTWNSGKAEYNSVTDSNARKTLLGRADNSYTKGKTDFNSFKGNTVYKTIGGKVLSSYTTTKSDYNGVVSNTVYKTIGGKVLDNFTSTKNNYNGVVSNTVTKSITGAVQKAFTNAKNDYNGVKSNTATKTVAGSIAKSFKDAKSEFNKVYSKTVEVGIKGVMSGTSTAAKNVVKSLFNALFKAEGGILTASGWQPIRGYASGGMPSSAEVFMARENGPELVGTIGGHTAVMNNDQIVASVANGVAQANMAQNELLRTQNALLRQILAKEVGITSRDIFNAVRSENNNHINRTGKSAFSY